MTVRNGVPRQHIRLRTTAAAPLSRSRPLPPSLSDSGGMTKRGWLCRPLADHATSAGAAHPVATRRPWAGFANSKSRSAGSPRHDAPCSGQFRHCGWLVVLVFPGPTDDWPNRFMLPPPFFLLLLPWPHLPPSPSCQSMLAVPSAVAARGSLAAQGKSCRQAARAASGSCNGLAGRAGWLPCLGGVCNYLHSR